MGADGTQGDILLMPGQRALLSGVKRVQSSAGMHYLKMAGKEVFKNAITAMQTAAEKHCDRCNITINESSVSSASGQSTHFWSHSRPPRCPNGKGLRKSSPIMDISAASVAIAIG